MDTFEFLRRFAEAGKNIPKCIEIAFGQFSIVFISVVSGLERFGLDDHFKEHTATGKEIYFISMVSTFFKVVG